MLLTGKRGDAHIVHGISTQRPTLVSTFTMLQEESSKQTHAQSSKQPQAQSSTKTTAAMGTLDPTGENAKRIREELQAEELDGIIRPNVQPRFGLATAGRIHGPNQDNPS